MSAPARVEPRGWSSCIVAATGPSLTEAVAETVAALAAEHHVIAVNDAWRRLPFADVLYAGDRKWWEVHAGCADFQGEKWAPWNERTNDTTDLAAKYGLHLVAGAPNDGFSFDPKRIHYGGNSGFQAINLAFLFGAMTVRLVGFDMKTPANPEQRHFFGRHPEPLSNRARYEQFLGAFKSAAKRLPPGRRIINCTPGSALTCFESGTLAEAVPV